MKREALMAARAKDGPNQSPKSSPAMRPEKRTATTETMRFMPYFFEPRLLLMSRRCDCGSNENKMSDGGRGRASLGVKVWKSSQKWSVRRSAVRSIAWLGLCGFIGGRGATI